MVPAWLMIICWVYLKLLVITRTDKLRLVPQDYIFYLLTVCMASIVASRIEFYVGDVPTDMAINLQNARYTRLG